MKTNNLPPEIVDAFESAYRNLAFAIARAVGPKFAAMNSTFWPEDGGPNSRFSYALHYGPTDCAIGDDINTAVAEVVHKLKARERGDTDYIASLRRNAEALLQRAQEMEKQTTA